MNIIEVRNLYKSYPQPGNKKESFNAVDGITFNIEVGEVYGILGPNGAGKTTTLEIDVAEQIIIFCESQI